MVPLDRKMTSSYRLFTFLFSPSPMQSILIPSHSHFQFCNQFPFPWDFHWAFPIPSHSRFQTVVQSMRAWTILNLSKTHLMFNIICVLLVVESTKFSGDHHALHYWTSQTTENMPNVTQLWQKQQSVVLWEEHKPSTASADGNLFP